MDRIYTLRKRFFANLFINILIVLAFYLTKDESQSFVLLVVALLFPAIICYGFYIASLCCHRCGQSYLLFHGDYHVQKFLIMFSSLHVPSQCRHCGADAH